MSKFKVHSKKGPIANELDNNKKLGTDFEVEGISEVGQLIMDGIKHKLITPMLESLEKTGKAETEFFTFTKVEEAAQAVSDVAASVTAGTEAQLGSLDHASDDDMRKFGIAFRNAFTAE